jgi:hypothetical protein
MCFVVCVKKAQCSMCLNNTFLFIQKLIPGRIKFWFDTRFGILVLPSTNFTCLHWVEVWFLFKHRRLGHRFAILSLYNNNYVELHEYWLKLTLITFCCNILISLSIGLEIF